VSRSLTDKELADALSARLSQRSGEGVTTLADLGKVDPRACPLCQVLGAHKHEMYETTIGDHKREKPPQPNITHTTGPTGLVEARGHGPFEGMSAFWRGPGDEDTKFSGSVDHDNFARAIAKYRALWGV
jgi:hypothetical protein